MPKKIRLILSALIVTVALVGAFSAGCAFPGASSPPPVAPPAAVTQATGTTGLNTIDEAWQILNKEYVDKSRINSANMTEAAIAGMIEALDDPYTSYMSPQDFQMSQQDVNGTFEGIGAYVGIRDKKLTITAPMPGSPADKAGIKPGDTVLEVNGKPTSAMSLEEAILNIRGPRGTTVTLQILHLGETEPVEIKIVRAAIQVPSVMAEMKQDIAYIRINQFTQHTDDELTKILGNGTLSGATGIILDLRSNPGGYVDEVVKVASHFIKEGTVLKIVDNKGSEEILSVRKTSVTSVLPIVALSDNFSASGSEVLMGALQDYGRATIAGTRTYGKGSVNQFFKLSDGSGLYITIARWFTPKGRAIERKGIEPDIQLTLHGDEEIQWAIDFLKGKIK